jgi:uncharacterized protein involved in outer membrane biogenesis
LIQLLQRWRKAMLIVVGLFIAYVVFGFLLLPRLIHNTVTEALAVATHRPVALAELKINPLALSATLRGLQIGTADQPLAHFEKIYINVALSSLWRGAYVFNVIRLQSPQVVIAINRKGRSNFQDLMAVEGAEESGPSPVVVIQTLEVLRGAIDFDDLSRPTPFRTNIATLDLTLHDFTTRRDESGNYRLHVATELGEMLDWQGSLQAAPFRSEGTLQLAGIHAETIWALAGAGFKFDLKDGLLDLNSRYLVDQSGAEPVVKFDEMSVVLRDLQLLRRGESEPVMTLPRLDVTGINLDFSRHALTIKALTIKDAQLDAVRETDGRLDLQTLFTKEPQPQPEEETPPWQIQLTSAQLQTATLQLEDRTTQPAAQWRLTPLNLALHNIEWESDKPIELQLDSGINDGGRADVRGTATLSPLSANLDVKLATLDLTATQPYVQQSAQLLLQHGLLDVEGHLGLEMGEEESAVSFNGDATVQQLRTVDALRSEEFLRWEQLAVTGVKYDSRAAHLSIAELALTAPYLRFIITQDSTTNLSHILATPVNVAPSATAPATETKAPPLITIDRVLVAKGALNFSDHSIKPAFSTTIQQINGAIRGLSSKEKARADVYLKGNVDRYAPASITGKINPLSDDAFTDLKFDFRGIEMSAFTTYSSKFAGYKIDKGKLNVELRYRLSKKVLRGENRIIIDQLQLGDAVDSPDATGLPVRLAIAILRDANGVIDLDLPITGRIDDPDFHYGRIIWMAIKNVIIKVATAPFRALASLLGGDGEEASQIIFTPGSTTLSAAELEKISKLAGALAQRPALLLEVRGSAGMVDSGAIAAAALDERLATQPGESRQQKINALYLKVYGEPAETLAPPLAEGESRTPQQLQEQSAEAAQTRLLEAMVVSDDELRALAQERAQTIVAAFTEGDSMIEADRIFLLDVTTQAEPSTAVVVPLSLQAR